MPMQVFYRDFDLALLKSHYIVNFPVRMYSESNEIRLKDKALFLSFGLYGTGNGT